LAVCCPDAMEETQRDTTATKNPHASRLCRRGAVIGFALLCTIEFYFSAAASARGAGVISMDQMDAGRMYMLAR
jgi:hypothetical protein